MKVVPIQFFGIGDVIWEQTLVKMIAEGNPIMWPVEPQFVSGLNAAYPSIFFVDRTKFNIDYNRKDDYVKDGIRYLPLRWCDTVMQVPYKRCMEVKYTFYGLDWHIWKHHAMWERNKEREESLYKLLGLEEGQEYTLVNRFFGSHSQLVAQIQEKGIEMCTVEGYSIFDWAKVIEEASAIHVVSSSIIYLTELLDLKAPEIHLYRRAPIEANFENVDYILQKHKYIQHL